MKRIDAITNSPRRNLIALGAGFALLISSTARGQCLPAWASLAGGTGLGAGEPLAVGVLDLDGSGPHPGRLSAGGGFENIGGASIAMIAQWDGWAWAPMGSGIGAPWTIGLLVETLRSEILPGAQTPELLVSGAFMTAGGTPAEYLARWNGVAWHGFSPGLTGTAHGIRAFDDDGPGPGGTAIYLGGNFTNAGGMPVRGLVRWDGTNWTIPGGGVQPWHPAGTATVMAFEVHDDDGPGPRSSALYVGGEFEYAGSVTVRNIARWDGAGWEPLSGGTTGSAVLAMASFDEDGTGPQRAALFAGGAFNSVGVPDTESIARWDGQQWSAVGSGVNNTVQALAVFDDDGPGPRKPALFAGGYFSSAGGLAASRIARWDGQFWSALDAGVTSHPLGPKVFDLTVFDEDGPGPNPGGLYVAGLFYTAGTVPSHGIARWGCPLPARCDNNCNKDFHPITGQHILNVFDFGCFQTRYVLQDPYADCNEDGALTVADFGCFQTKFVVGCP